LENPEASRLFHRTALLLLTIFALLSSLMIVRLALGETNPIWATPTATLACFLFAVLHACTRLGWKQGLTLLALCFGISLFFESAGVATGWVYGGYHYLGGLGPSFLGLVPFLIPLAWFMMMYPAFLMSRWLTPRLSNRWLRTFCLAGLGGVIMAAWDLTLDPLMVLGGQWLWKIPGAYFGIPIQNYFGWCLTTFLTFASFLLLWPSQLEAYAADVRTSAVWDR